MYRGSIPRPDTELIQSISLIMIADNQPGMTPGFSFG